MCKSGNHVKGLNIFQMEKEAKTHNPYKFLMLALPSNFSNFIYCTHDGFVIKSLCVCVWKMRKCDEEVDVRGSKL